MSELAEDLNDADESLTDMIEEETRNKRKQNLEQERERVEQEYDDIINDETMWENVRTDVIDGKTNEVMKSFTNMLNAITNETDILGKSVVSNLKREIDGLNAYLKGVKTNNKAGNYTDISKSSSMPTASTNTVSSLGTSVSNSLNGILSSSLSDTIKTNLQNIFAKTLQLPNVATTLTGGNQYSLTLHIGSLNGTKEDAQTLLAELETGLRKIGG